VPNRSFIFFSFNVRVAAIPCLQRSRRLNGIRKRSMRAPSSSTAIVDGLGLKWDCWPKGTGWKYGSDLRISTVANLKTRTLALDGEIVVFDSKRGFRFKLLQQGKGRQRYVVFDVLYANRGHLQREGRLITQNDGYKSPVSYWHSTESILFFLDQSINE
jgi:hypothetical protein